MTWLYDGPSLSFLTSTALIAGAAEEDDVALIATITAPVTVVSTTLTDLHSFVIPDNDLIAGDIIEMWWEGSLLQNDSAQTAQWAVLYDGVTIFTYTTASISQNTNRRRWMVHCIMNVRTPATQYNSVEGEISNVSAEATAAVTGTGSGYAVKATTTDFDAGPKTIKLQGRMVSTAVAVDIRLDMVRILKYRV